MQLAAGVQGSRQQEAGSVRRHTLQLGAPGGASGDCLTHLSQRKKHCESFLTTVTMTLLLTAMTLTTQLQGSRKRQAAAGTWRGLAAMAATAMATPVTAAAGAGGHSGAAAGSGRLVAQQQGVAAAV